MKRSLGKPPRQAAGGLLQGPQASAWGLTARKDAVWAEGLADLGGQTNVPT